MNSRLLLRLSRINLQKFCYNRERELIRYFSVDSKRADTNEIDSEPIRYSKSAAYEYKAKTTRTGVSVSRLWYEPYVIIASISIFLLYFTMIREENDIDEELSKSLYSRISGLEEHQLKLSLEYNQQNGLETKAIIDRLIEIKKQDS